MKLKSYLRGLGTGIFISAVLMGIAVSGKTKELSDAEIKTRAKALGMVEEGSVLVKPTTEPEEVKEDTETKTEPEAKPETRTEAKSEKKAEDKTDINAAGEDGAGPENTAEEDVKVPAGGSKDTGIAVLEEEPEPTDEPETQGALEDDADNDIRGSKEDLAMGGQSEKKSSNEKVSGLQNSSKELGYNEFFTIQIASGSSSETVSRLLKSGGAIDDADEFDDYLCSNHYDKKIAPGVFKIPVGADYQQIADIITGGK